jgi:hypothetical protein
MGALYLQSVKRWAINRTSQQFILSRRLKHMPVRAYHPQGAKGPKDDEGERYDEIDRVVFTADELPRAFRTATRIVIHAEVPEHGAGAGEYDLSGARGEHTGLTVWAETPARPGGSIDYAGARELYLLMIDQQRAAGYQSRKRAKRSAARGDRPWSDEPPRRGRAHASTAAATATTAHADAPARATVKAVAEPGGDGQTLRVALSGVVDVVLSGGVPATVPLALNGGGSVNGSKNGTGDGHNGAVLAGIATVAKATAAKPAAGATSSDGPTTVAADPAPVPVAAANAPAKGATGAAAGRSARRRPGRSGRRGTAAAAPTAARVWTSQS